MSETLDSSNSASGWLVLLGLLVFVGSALLFVVDLIRGVDVLRSVAINGVGAIVLIGWAALDTYRSEESEVTTLSGALGTALMLYGLYLSVTGLALSATGLFFHDRLSLGAFYLGLSIGALVTGYIVTPIGVLLGDETVDHDDTDTGK
jgi:hypothetical protein